MTHLPGGLPAYLDEQAARDDAVGELARYVREAFPGLAFHERAAADLHEAATILTEIAAGDPYLESGYRAVLAEYQAQVAWSAGAAAVDAARAKRARQRAMGVVEG